MRLIDADALLEQMKHRRDYVGRPSDPVCLVEDAPTVEPMKEQEQLIIRSGRIDEIYNHIAECPECGMEWAMWLPDKMRYCPGCGRKVEWG